MQLYLLRHADADTVADRDDARCLSEKGLAQSRKVARFCERCGFAPESILTSPVRRAHETALLVSAHLRSELVLTPWLACGMDPERAVSELRDYRDAQGGVMIVGHEPDFSRLVAHLLGMPAERVVIRKASLTLLEVEAFRAGGALLHFSVPCRMM